MFVWSHSEKLVEYFGTKTVAKAPKQLGIERIPFCPSWIIIKIKTFNKFLLH